MIQIFPIYGEEVLTIVLAQLLLSTHSLDHMLLRSAAPLAVVAFRRTFLNLVDHAIKLGKP